MRTIIFLALCIAFGACENPEDKKFKSELEVTKAKVDSLEAIIKAYQGTTKAMAKIIPLDPSLTPWENFLLAVDGEWGDLPGDPTINCITACQETSARNISDCNDKHRKGSPEHKACVANANKVFEGCVGNCTK